MDEQQQQTTMQKPPLGLRPRFIVVEHRTLEILEAMIRYVQVGYRDTQKRLCAAEAARGVQCVSLPFAKSVAAYSLQP